MKGGLRGDRDRQGRAGLLDSLDLERRREGRPPDAHPQVSSIAPAGDAPPVSSTHERCASTMTI